MLWVPCNASSFFFFLLTLVFVVVVVEAFSYTQRVPVRSTYSPDRVLSGREVLTRYYIAQQSVVCWHHCWCNSLKMIGRWVFHLLRRHWSTYPFLCVHIPSSNWYVPTLPLLLLFVHASHLMQTLLVPSWKNQKKTKKSIRVNWHEKNTTTGQWHIWINNEAIIIIRWNWRIFIFDIQQSILCTIHTIFDLMLIESHHQIELSSGKLRQRQLPHTYTE